MSRFFMDHNIAHDTASALRKRGHDVLTAWEARSDRATDDVHLLAAAQSNRILLTADFADFTLLHDAWRRWFSAYPSDPAPAHSGILIIPQPNQRSWWLPEDTATEVDAFVRGRAAFSNDLFYWKLNRGWVQRQFVTS